MSELVAATLEAAQRRAAGAAAALGHEMMADWQQARPGGVWDAICARCLKSAMVVQSVDGAWRCFGQAVREECRRRP